MSDVEWAREVEVTLIAAWISDEVDVGKAEEAAAMADEPTLAELFSQMEKEWR